MTSEIKTRKEIYVPVREIVEDYSQLNGKLTQTERKQLGPELGFTTDLFIYKRIGDDIKIYHAIVPQPAHQKEKFSIEKTIARDNKDIKLSELELQGKDKTYGYIQVNIPNLLKDHNDTEKRLIQTVYNGNGVNLNNAGVKSTKIYVPRKETIDKLLDTHGKILGHDTAVLFGYLYGLNHNSDFIAGYVEKN